jgi:hypothetical protein
MHDVGEHDTGHEIDLVAFDQPLEGLLGHVRLELVVDHGHVGWQATEPAAVELDGEHEGVANVDAQRSRRSRQGADETDLDLVTGKRRETCGGCQEGCGRQADEQSGTPEVSIAQRSGGVARH